MMRIANAREAGAESGLHSNACPSRASLCTCRRTVRIMQGERPARASTWRRRSDRRTGGNSRRRRRPLLALSDQTGIAAARGIYPQPAQGNGEPIAHADQEVDMSEAPYPPGEPAAQLDPTEIDDRRTSADGG